MVTLGTFIEYEHAVPKMAATSTSSVAAVAMIAGDTLIARRMTDEVVASSGATEVAGIAHELAAKYGAVRQIRMEETHLWPRGLTLNNFYQAHQSLQPQIVAMIDAGLKDYNLGVEVLLAGVDASGGHIFTVMNPGGTERLWDIIGYTAIGSGGIHATQAMIGYGHAASADYHETVFRAYAAKRRAEAAPGVGHDTDMGVISATGIHWLSTDELNQLGAIYADYETSMAETLAKKLASFTLGRQGDDDGG